MAVEMSGTRLLAPYFGTSLFVWTNVISVILVAMAVGYALGGRMADQHPDPRLYFFWIAVTGIWVMAIPFFSPLILPMLSSGLGTLEQSLRFGSLIAVALLFAFPMLLFGLVVPFTVRLCADELKSIATLSGRISAVSTVGSLVGTFLPAFVLIPQLGTTKTFVLIGLILFLLAAFGLRKWWLVLLGFLGTGLFWVVPPVYAASDVVASVESPYGYIFVTSDAAGVRSLHIDNTIDTQSIYDPAMVLPPKAYYYAYFALLPGMIEQPKTVLILGHAAGTFTRIFNAYDPDLEITGVELDPAVTKMANETMGMADARVNIVHADARQFLLNSETRYDLILVDAYHGANIPAHLATQEFFQLCHDHLNSGGIVALNAVSDKGAFLDELSNSLAKPFTSVLSFPVPGSFNTMLVARDSLSYDREDLPGSTVLTYNAAQPTFIDEKLSEVELKNEEMFMQVLAQW